MAEAMFHLKGGVALVTGGGQGIGAAICRRLAAAGAKVAIFDRQAEPSAALARALDGIAVVGDVISEADVARALIGPFLWCRAVIPGMLARRYGRVVNIASIAGKEGNPTLGPYSASKAALICLTKSLAKEVAGKGDVTVNAVSPAVIATPILEGLPETTVNYMVSRIPMGRTGKPEEVAALVHYLASPEASFTTGQCYDISGGRATY